jgi:hypothetical protein
MGNTNLPQFGAANAKNSRDSEPGDQQLTDKQKKAKKTDHDSPEKIAPSPSNGTKGEPEQIPGQNVNPNPNAAK